MTFPGNPTQSSSCRPPVVDRRAASTAVSVESGVPSTFFNTCTCVLGTHDAAKASITRGFPEATRILPASSQCHPRASVPAPCHGGVLTTFRRNPLNLPVIVLHAAAPLYEAPAIHTSSGQSRWCRKGPQGHPGVRHGAPPRADKQPLLGRVGVPTDSAPKIRCQWVINR